MRYDEFRDQLEAALQRNSLHFRGLRRVETIELANTVYIGRSTPTEPHLRAPSPGA